MKFGAVHLLSDGDYATIPTCHCIPSNTTEDREVTGRMGGRAPQDLSGGDPAHVLTIFNHHPQRGFQRAQG